jgi:hypothetical protein
VGAFYPIVDSACNTQLEMDHASTQTVKLPEVNLPKIKPKF